MAIPVSEDERTPEGARDRFRRVTGGALETLQESVYREQSVTAALDALKEACRDAILEYRRNLRQTL